MEDGINGIWYQWKRLSMEDGINGRWYQWKMVSAKFQAFYLFPVSSTILRYLYTVVVLSANIDKEICDNYTQE